MHSFLDNYYTTAVYPRAAGYSFPGRQVRFDIVYDPATGRKIHYIDGWPVGTSLEPACIGIAANQAFVEGLFPGVKIVAFGASKQVPESLFKEAHISVISGYSPIPSSTFTTEWQALFTFKILYPPSGVVAIEASPLINSQNYTNVFMNVGPASASQPDLHATPFRVLQLTSAPWGGVVNFFEYRSGIPGTVEEVSIFAKIEGNGATYGGYNAGPRVRSVASMKVTN
ncbi:MAG: hypothetical protein WCF18_03180 [Chthoniobacteraceae bacterium]